MQPFGLNIIKIKVVGLVSFAVGFERSPPVNRARSSQQLLIGLIFARDSGLWQLGIVFPREFDLRIDPSSAVIDLSIGYQPYN